MEAVINAFWEHGYEATSMADLMAATGLQKGSIYKAFGNKRSLFLKALQAYLDRSYGKSCELLSHSSPETAIASWLQSLLDSVIDPSECKGCLAVNTLIEKAPHDLEIAKILKRYCDRLSKLLEAAISQGQAQGVFRTDLSAQQLRQLLVMAANGASTSGRVPFLKTELPEAIETLFAVLKA